MYPRVTAIVVARSGDEHLRRTLDALSTQTRPPDAVIVIAVASSDATAQVIADSKPTHYLVSSEKLSFGMALATAARVAPPPDSEHEWLWLLAQDTAPEPEALQRLLATVEVSPSVAVAGPKLVDWDDTTLIRDLGESMTPLGASVPLVQDELDQAQHDGLSDVLGMASAGMIVRHTVWEQLGGLDRGLPVVDDGLDFCVRARLAGYRVVMVPTAVVASAGDGVSGPSRSGRWANRRRLYRERRAAQLHRRLVYAPGSMLAIHWLSLVPLALIRSIIWLLGKQPGAMGGEIAAAFGVAFGATHVGEARSSLARTKSVRWGAIAPLRMQLAEVRRARALRREAAMMRSRGERKELDFFSGGGAWVVIGSAVVSVALFVPLLGASRLSGGSLLPLNATVGELWQNTGWGWRDIGLGFVGSADPFSAVLAILGSLTFWQPSLVLVLLWFAAIPLAALGAWLCATRITDRAGLRALFALAWACAPMLFDALQSGRPAAVLAHVLLPWLFFAAFAGRRSWTASATSALLTAAVLACAPSLAPALLVIWVIWLVSSGRRVARVILVPLPSLVLFAPLVWQQVMRGSWLSVFADPGAPVLSHQTPGWQLALGFPDGTLGGWYTIADAFHLPALAPGVVVAVLLAPIAVLGILALFLRGTVRAVLSLVVALLGFGTAVAAVHIQLAAAGSQPVALWAGAGLSLYWLGLTGAAVLGLGALGRFAIAPAWVALVALAVAVAPLAAALPLGRSSVSASTAATLPAYVTAEAGSDARVGTLQLTPEPDGSLAAHVVRGTGTTLDEQSTLSSTRRTLTASEKSLASLAGNLASASGLDPSTDLKQFGIGFVLLTPPATTVDDATEPASSAVSTRAATALDGNARLASVGSTDFGQLWSVKTAAASQASAIPVAAGGWMRTVYFVVLGIVFGMTLLLSIPTGRAERGVLRRPSAAEIGAVSTRADDEPDEPDEPGEPDEPDVRDEPETLNEPDAPGEPDEPDVRDEPETLNEADALSEPDRPNEPNEDGGPPSSQDSSASTRSDPDSAAAADADADVAAAHDRLGDPPGGSRDTAPTPVITTGAGDGEPDQASDRPRDEELPGGQHAQ